MDWNKDRLLAAVCDEPMSLVTSFEADTVVYGTMFTIQSKSEPIDVLTMEISANPIGTEMNVEIYTKVGDFVGSEKDSTQWTKIVDTSVIPAREGRGTIIPPSEFQAISMLSNELRAFFISLKTSDLRYKRDESGENSGRTYVSDGYLSINSGVGIGAYGFNDQIFPSRLFTGIMHYTHKTDCAARKSKLLISYSYHVRPKGNAVLSKTDISNELSNLVGEAFGAILDTELSSIRDQYQLQVEGLSCTFSNLKREKCPVSGWSDCAPFDCQTTITHLNTIAGGNLEYLVYQYNDDLTNRIQGGNLDAQYSGRATMIATVLIAFKGTPIGALLDSEQQRFVETITSSFIAEGLVGLTNVNVVGTKIIYQNGPGVSSSRRLQEISSQADNWIELTVDVLATLTPPYKGNVEFDELVLSSFRTSREDYIYDLKNYRFRPGSLVEGKRGDYFMSITQVNARKSEDGQTPGRGSVLPKGSTGFGTINSIIFSSICIALLVLGIVWFVRRRKRVSAKDNSEGIFVTGQTRRRSLIAPAFGFEEAMGRLSSKPKDKALQHGRKENSSGYRFVDAEAQDSQPKVISNKSRIANQQSRVPQTRKARQESKLESSKQQLIEKSHSQENSLEGSSHSGGRTKVRSSGSTERQFKNEIEKALQLSLQDEKARKTQASPSRVKERNRGREDQSSKARDIVEQLGKSLDRSKSMERPETSPKSESDLEIALRLSLQDQQAQTPSSNVQGKQSPSGISKQSDSNVDPTHPRSMAQLSENFDHSGISLEASQSREKVKSSAAESDLELALRLSLQDEKERKAQATTSHVSEENRRSRGNEGVTSEKSTPTQMRSSDRSIENIDKSTSSDVRSRSIERVTASAESKRSKPESDLELALRLSLQDEKVRQAQVMSNKSPNENQNSQGAVPSSGVSSEPSRQLSHGQSSGNSDQLDSSSPQPSRSNLKVKTSSPSNEIVYETDLEMALRLSLQQETGSRSQETSVPTSSDHVGGKSAQSSRPLVSGGTNTSARINDLKHSSRATRSTVSRSAVQGDDIAAAIALSLQEENARKSQMMQSKSQSMKFSRDKTGVGTDSRIQESKSMRTTRSQAFPVVPKTSESSIRASRTTTSSLMTSTQPQSSLLSSEPSSSKLQTSKSVRGPRSIKPPQMAKSTSVRFSDSVKGPGSQELQSSQSLSLDRSTASTDRSSSELTVADQDRTSAQPSIRGSASMRGPRSSLQQTQSVRFSRTTGTNKDERMQGSKSMRGPRTNP